jgi:integrase
MSAHVNLKAATDSTTNATLAELHTRLLADDSLADGRRRDMISALASIAKALRRPPETLAANPSELRPLLAGLTPAMVGHRPGRWKNILSLLSAALAHVGIVRVQGRIRDKPSSAWLAILNRLDAGAGRHFHLWRFARYCSQQGIDPGVVSDAVIAGYQRDLEAQSLVAEPARSARDAARFWNSAADTSPDWPQQHLHVPDNRSTYALPWAAYPASLQRDVEAWLAWLGGSDPFNERDFSPLRPKSVATRLRQLREYLAGLVHQGVDPQDLVDLAAVVTPARAQQGLRFFWDRAGQKKSAHSYQVAGVVVMIARHWAKLAKADIDRLRSVANLLRPVSGGMTGKNVSRLRQLEDPGRLNSLLGLPAVLLEEARRSGAPSMRSAQQVQTAVAIELLLQIPMRLSNLCGLRIGVHLLGGSGKQMFISIPPHEIKNEVALEASLPEAAATLIAIYLERYRPLLTKAGGDWLFPGARLGSPKTEMGLRAPMQKALATRCGLRFNPHLFRHMAAWLTLRQNPGAHGQVQRILGHKSLSSTMAFYSGLEGPAALQHYDRLVSDLRDAALVRGPRKRRLGAGG